MPTVHDIVGELLYARNFYIAMLSDDGEQLEFPYSVDERDVDRAPRKLASGPDRIRARATDEPLLADRARHRGAGGDRQGAQPRQRWRIAGSACR